MKALNSLVTVARQSALAAAARRVYNHPVMNSLLARDSILDYCATNDRAAGIAADAPGLAYASVVARNSADLTVAQWLRMANGCYRVMCGWPSARYMSAKAALVAYEQLSRQPGIRMQVV
jgi:hypothetical protein